MNFQGSFNKIGTLDVSHFKHLLDQLSQEHWLEDTQRQRRYEVHRQTQSIGIVYDYDFRHANPTIQPSFRLFEPALMPAVKMIAAHFDDTDEGVSLAQEYGPGYCIRANLVSLNPGGRIEPHQDKNFSLTHSHRIHIPLVTNPLVKFDVGGEIRYLMEGEVIEINNRRTHSVINESNSSRIHLIIDWVIAGQQCCCAAKTHPNSPCNPEACLQTDRLNIPCTCYEI